LNGIRLLDFVEYGHECAFERRYGLLSAHGRKLLQEFIERIASLQIIEEVVDRDTYTDELQALHP
jgi:hypothetical protein